MKTTEWMQLLDQLTAALECTSVEVARHEQTLASPLLTSDLSDERHISWQRALERFGEHLNDCRGQVEQAERQTLQAESAMSELEEAVSRYRAMIAEARTKLSVIPK
jgi:hypothetical protein